MHLLNAAVAVTSALVGTVGATMAYGALNTSPIGHTEPTREPVMLTHHLPCEPPSRLTDGVCVTTVVRTVVKTAAPVVITRVVKVSSPKHKAASSPAKAAARTEDKHKDEGDDHGDDQGDDHGEDHGDD